MWSFNYRWFLQSIEKSHCSKHDLVTLQDQIVVLSTGLYFIYLYNICMCIYIYIYPFILFYLSIIITNIVDHQTCLKKCYTKLLFLFCLMLLLLICGYFGIGFSLGTLFLGCLGLDFCSASLPLSLPLHPSFRSDYDLRFCSWWVWCCSYLYNLRSLSISAMYMLCFRIFLYSSIVCFALVIIVSIYIYIYI